MALTTTAAMDKLVAVLEELVAEDPSSVAGQAQLGNTDALIVVRDRIEHLVSRYINAMWTSEATVDLVGKTVKGWLVDDLHLAPSDAGARIATARELLRREQVDKAFAAGQISCDHAKTLTSTLRKLPEELQDFAESELVDAAKASNPASLGRACKDLIEHLDLNEDADARYARLYGQRYLRTSSTIDGFLKVDAMLDPVTAAAFKAGVASLSAKQGADDDRTKAQRDHDALGALVALALRTGSLPEHGGAAPQIVVTTPLEELTYQLDHIRVPLGNLDGTPLPPSVVRMLACDAGIIPAVMNGHSQVLDVGRSTRTWTKAQRLAARLRDGDTCTWPGGCSIPIRYCELHHLEFWTEHHGKTDLANAAHICSFHHWLVHNRSWKLWRNPTGTLECRRT